MCRYQCDCQPSCAAIASNKSSRFVVTPVKEQQQQREKKEFLRNKNVKFFAAESDDDSDDEIGYCSRPYTTAATSLYEENEDEDKVSQDESLDSGFDEMDNQNESDESEKEIRGGRPKSILKRQKDTVEGQEKRKKVRFADKVGQPLVQYRLVPSRQQEQRMMAKMVPIEPAIFGDHGRALALMSRLRCY